MADCYYHGQSSPGPCPVCARERARDVEQGSISSSENPFSDLSQEDMDQVESKKFVKPGTIREV